MQRSEASAPFTIDLGIGIDPPSLSRFPAARAASLEQTLHRHGAILVRSDAIRTEADFERAVRSIPGLRPMSGYFMSEPGRDRVAGSEHVFHTNTLARTGGALHIGAVHSENYYSTDR